MNGMSLTPGRDNNLHSAHGLVAVERHEMTVRGVQEVLSFDENNVRLVTTAGILNLEGRDFRIHSLKREEGIVEVTGTLDGILYENEDRPNELPPARRRFGRRS